MRLGHLFDEAVKYARSRTEEIHAPGERAQVMARGVVKAATEQLHDSLPLLAKDVRALAPLGEEVAARVGRGLVAGIESKLREDSGLLVGLVERAGQDLVRGLAAGLREELAASPGVSGAALASSLEQLAERTAAATVRGAGGALADEGRRWRESPGTGGGCGRRAGRSPWGRWRPWERGCAGPC